MNVLLVAVGSAGDVHPFVGLGIALRRRGHRVTLITCSYFEPLVRQAGLEFASFASVDDYQAMIAHPHIWGRFRGFAWIVRQGVIPALRPIYRAVVERYIPGETVVAASSLGLGARAAQETHGIPLATVHLSPVVFRSDYQNPVLPAMFLPDWLPVPLKRAQYWLADVGVVDRVLTPSLNRFRAEIGLPPLRGRFADWLHSPERVVGLFPDWYAQPQPDWPRQTMLAGFPLYDERDVSEPGDDVRRFLEAAEPPVVFTPGSAVIHGRRFFEAASDACRRLGRRGMLLTRFPEQLPPSLPEGVRHFDYVPFSWLLPRAAALVHHGGIGTLSQALAAGIPQLVMPMSHDQPDNAARLARLGVGEQLRPGRFRGRTVAAALSRLLGSAEVRTKCRAAADKFAGAAPLETACELIEQLGAPGAAAKDKSCWQLVAARDPSVG